MTSLRSAIPVIIGVLAVTGCGKGGLAERQDESADSTKVKTLTLDLGGNVTLTLAEIPAGQFVMGSPETEKGRDKEETQREVTFKRPFYMGVTHVTVDQFGAFVKDTGYKTDEEREEWSAGFDVKDGAYSVRRVVGCSWRDPSFPQKGDHPVVRISWSDAKAFCSWLSKRSGKTVVLPSSAQWEYACRAGTKTAYPWGDDPEDGKGWGNFADQSLKKTLPNSPTNWTFYGWDDGYVFTSPVASFRANAFGLYDMIGNAWQWSHSPYVVADYDKGSGSGESEPDGLHVLRGGSWLDADEDSSRSANRRLVWEVQGAKFFDVRSFRVAIIEPSNAE